MTTTTTTETRTRLSALVSPPPEPAEIALRPQVLPPESAVDIGDYTGARHVGSTEAVPHVSGHSPQMGQIAAAVAAAQGEIKLAIANQEGTSRGKNSGVEFKFDYADLGAIIEVCCASLSQHKVARFQPAKVIGNRVSVTTLLVHGGSGEWIAETLELPIEPGVLTTAQAIGGAISYARRYGLTALLGIGVADGEDIDAHRHNGNGSSVRPGQGPVQMPERAKTMTSAAVTTAPASAPPSSRTAPPPGSGPQTPAAGFTIKAFERKKTAGPKSKPYWLVQFSTGDVASTFSTSMGDAIERAHAAKTVYADVVITKKNGYAYIEELLPAAGGDQW